MNNEFRVTKLVAGLGSPEEGGCWMAAISYYAGEEWNDHPECVCPVIAKLCIVINDLISNDEERARLIGPRLYDPIGTVSDPLVALERTYLFIDRFVRKIIPKVLAELGFPDKGLSSLSEISDKKSTLEANLLIKGILDYYRSCNIVTLAHPSEDSDLVPDVLGMAESATKDIGIHNYINSIVHIIGIVVDVVPVMDDSILKEQNLLNDLFDLLDDLLSIGNSAPKEIIPPACEKEEFETIFAPELLSA